VLHHTNVGDQINTEAVRERVEVHVGFGWGNPEGKKPLGRTRPR